MDHAGMAEDVRKAREQEYLLKKVLKVLNTREPLYYEIQKSLESPYCTNPVGFKK